MKPHTETIRVGVVGVGRGQSFASGATDRVGMKLVALCDTWEEKLNEAGQRYGAAAYTDYDRFLEHDMDAVVLANYFHEHAPFALKALAAGKHVMSETAANATLAEGVALCRAVERSGKIYMFAENYPFARFNAEYADDHWSPWPEHAGPGQPPPSIRGFVEPIPEAVARGQAIWAEAGYADATRPGE